MDTHDIEVLHPLALSRMGTMVGALLEEIRRGPLGPCSRHRLRVTFDRALAETHRLVPEAQGRELDRLLPPLDDTTVSDADLRIAHAQLVGWLQGVFSGAQLAGFVEESRTAAQPAGTDHRGRTLATAGRNGASR